MARFFALPVGQGDAFYLEDGKFSVLVDGGKSRSGLPDIFKTYAGAKPVSVLVCTHNDADHAEGLIGYLEDSLVCDEIWLPGRWLGVLPDVLKPFVEIYGELEKDVVSIGSAWSNENRPDRARTSALEQYAETLQTSTEELSGQDDLKPLSSDGWPSNCIEALEGVGNWDIPVGSIPFGNSIDRLQWILQNRSLDSEENKLLWSALSAANRIRQIAALAFHQGIPVRWFEFHPGNAYGGRPELKPLNAREIATIRPRRGSLLAYLALTEVNKESLVFWAPGNENHPGVVFTADSDLAGVAVPNVHEGAIVTAPHHGSEANASAYAALNAALSPEHYKSLRWVRSDGRFRSRPGIAYLGVPADRTCTICRITATDFTCKQTVQFMARSGQWARYSGVRQCKCTAI